MQKVSLYLPGNRRISKIFLSRRAVLVAMKAAAAALCRKDWRWAGREAGTCTGDALGHLGARSCHGDGKMRATDANGFLKENEDLVCAENRDEIVQDDRNVQGGPLSFGMLSI